jgi:hypothetical protein
MFAKLFDWKSPVRSAEVPETQLMRGATELVSCIAREHCGYKGRVCTPVARGRGSVYPVAEWRVQMSCRRDCWCVVLSITISVPVSDLFADAFGNYTNKTVRFRVEFDPHYNVLSTPNTPLLSDPSSSSGSTWSPLGTPVMNSRRSSIGIERGAALFAGPGTGHFSHTSQHMRHPSASPRNSRTSSSSASAYSRTSMSGASVTGIICTVSFVQEKGAYSTLRIVYAKVKDGWK